MRKTVTILIATILGVTCCLGVSSCYASANMGLETRYNRSIPSVDAFFPRVDGSFVGDPMPMVADNRFNVFYLNDIRGGGDLGVHAFHLLETEDLYHYTNHSEILPYINDLKNPELLLGTGSIIKVGDVWHAWYTAHNANVFPVESIMHATSSDKLNWVKHPEDTILPSANYSGNDFRDPNVTWIPEKNEYWMLITTRQNGKGVIAKYRSKDLKNWEDDGIFFKNDTVSDNANLECPTLLFFNGKWYLSFSDQWPNRLTQYRYANSPDGPFVKPTNYSVDGAGFYAGKTAIKDDRLYVFGWNPTKSPNSDQGNIDWAGNLVVHELVQNSDGSLSSVMPKELNAVIKNRTAATLPLTPNQNLKNITTNFGKIDTAFYQPLPKKSLIEGSIKGSQYGAILSFGVEDSRIHEAPLNIVFNKKVNKVLFYNSQLDALPRVKPELGLNVDLQGDISLKVLIENEIAVFYINDKAAFTVRMYGMVDKPWAISSDTTENPTINLQINTLN
ncbi:glycoside hydrolase family 32 protein [Orbaceae bacterium ESL0721]|nr:glycoside hydrolase family 32 protein [Orbaceae bacterium ESL0721]